MEQIVISLSMVQKFTNLRQKILKLWQLSKNWSIDNIKLDLMDISMVLVLIMMLLMLMTY